MYVFEALTQRATHFEQLIRGVIDSTQNNLLKKLVCISITRGHQMQLPT